MPELKRPKPLTIQEEEIICRRMTQGQDYEQHLEDSGATVHGLHSVARMVVAVVGEILDSVEFNATDREDLQNLLVAAEEAIALTQGDQHPSSGGTTMDGYQGQKFTREQLVFMAEAILDAAVDRIEGGMPTSDVTWEERLAIADGDAEAACRLLPYDRGAMETTGMALAVLYAQLTGDGLGIGDALGEANYFEQAVENWVHTAWRDKGTAVVARIDRFRGTTWNITDAYANYPDCRRHAKAFVDNVFDEYLAIGHQQGASLICSP